jgi:hypothetical protein
MGSCVRFVTLLLLSFAFGVSAMAREEPESALPEKQQLVGSVENPWIRLPAVAGRPAAGYVTIVNKSPFYGHLIGVDSDRIQRAMIHHSSEENGVARMRHVNQALIPEGGALLLAPGGYHLMLMGLDRDIEPGDEVIIRLHLKGQAEEAKIVPVPFTVLAFGEAIPE